MSKKRLALGLSITFPLAILGYFGVKNFNHYLDLKYDTAERRIAVEMQRDSTLAAQGIYRQQEEQEGEETPKKQYPAPGSGFPKKIRTIAPSGEEIRYLLSVDKSSQQMQLYETHDGYKWLIQDYQITLAKDNAIRNGSYQPYTAQAPDDTQPYLHLRNDNGTVTITDNKNNLSKDVGNTIRITNAGIEELVRLANNAKLYIGIH